MYDVAIVGGGVIGAFCARELMKYQVSAVVLEAADDVAAGASRANSGIVHAGFDALPGTLKAKFNLEGNAMMQSVCRELGVPFRRNGSLVLAHRAGMPILETLLERGRQNGVPDLEIIERDRLLEMEPHVCDDAAYALYAPTGGIVCPYELTIAALGNAMDNGARLVCGFRVSRAERTKDGWMLFSESGDSVAAKLVVNCAGNGAQAVARLFGDASFCIGARKGEYILLDKSAGAFVSHTVFSVPTAAGKGVLVSPTADGNVILGPTSVEEAQPDTSIRRGGFEEIARGARMIMKDIPLGQVITSFAGVRAYSDRHDFIVEWSASADGVFHAAGIESPGLTSAPAIGRTVAAELAARLGAKANETFSPFRKPFGWFRSLSAAEKSEVIAREPAFGKIVCRCEEVTLGEILEAVHANPPARTLDGIKLRTRAGMGRCQSGFCQPSVFETLRKECGMRIEEVTKNGGRSYIIAGEI